MPKIDYLTVIFPLALLTLACSSSKRVDEGGGGQASAAGASAAGASAADASAAGGTPDSGGWVVVTGWHPPLLRRAIAVTCPEALPALDECRKDDDCGPGAACACGGPSGPGLVNQCLPAECRTDQDCDGRACLLSIGSEPSDCCATGERGLYCARDNDACEDGCPGNGIACMYSVPNDRFECTLLSCSCE